MHQFFVALVSLLFSFCHHSANHSAEAFAYQGAVPSPTTLSFPDRRDLARESGVSGYAEATCTSCLRMSTNSVVR